MPFKPNDSNINRNGRTKGTTNKATAKLRETIQLIHTNNLDFIYANLNHLTMKERLQLNRDLLPFIAPRYATIHEVEKHEAHFNPIEVKIIHSNNENNVIS